ncbi:MAG TPA: hypothetical protein VKA97_14040, partial [Pyrinomonadaceae bacterium]|nr:hypothetical protein [Pyrinomonadaceae bacterium]
NKPSLNSTRRTSGQRGTRGAKIVSGLIRISLETPPPKFFGRVDSHPARSGTHAGLPRAGD